MKLRPVVDAFARSPGTADLSERLPGRGEARRLGGLAGSSGSVLAAWLANTHPQRQVMVVATTPGEAERWLSDLTLLTEGAVALYPQREALGEEEPHYEIAGERVETIEALLRGQVRVVVTTARATAERTLVPAALDRLRLRLVKGERRAPAAVATTLEAMGYRRVATVTEVAEFSVRGGILDVYGFGMAAPARAEWWGDDVSSIRGFDLTTQRSLQEMEEMTVLPVSTRSLTEESEPAEAPARKTLLELLPSDTFVLEESAGSDRDEVERAWRRGGAPPGGSPPAGRGRAEAGRDPGESRDLGRTHRRISPAHAERRAGRYPVRLLPPGADRPRPQPAPLPARRLAAHPDPLRQRGPARAARRAAGRGRPGRSRATLAIGALDGGFVMPSLRVLTDHEIFRRARRLRRARRYRQAAPSIATGALTVGDYVVHLDHGIGIYRGIQTIMVGESTLEVAIVEYEGGDRLNVPLYRLDQLERYRAAGEDGDRPPPRIHRLGGTSWQRVRERTRQAIRQMAAELLDLYARRTVSAGYPFPPDTKWQRELESSFLYEDTPDQRTATEEVKSDMERPLPMDRLLVGDVGYGKTEIAVRAAFKAVQGGKQVAVLVPTTILAEQHGRTFSERLADFPVKIEILSRFRTAAEQKAALTRLAEGSTDIVIGTHRLLSKDVVFKDLGLLVVDEEHRFGVRHKERLKALRLAVDVLTLTATPIPRTLHLSLAGLRDLTLIETAPRDRSPILTFVEPWDDALLEEAFAREIDRGGQVFVVHNRIETIETIAAKVRSLAPRARIGVAHGQMPADELETVMQGFVSGEVNILVSTMIVESGLDVPNANTMVVHDAHRFGLAQLYQLRGRVGRSHRRAYCYLLVPDAIDADAEERLRVLEHHTDLGAGYRIALKDLELRGAGNLLGAEQSGHAHAVGFELYMRWLEETVRSLRGQGAAEQPAPPDVVLDRPAHLPDGYVPDDDVKLDLYRRLARAVAPGDIDGLRDELRERFGPLPAEAETLLHMARLRVLGAALGLQHVLVRGDEARLTFRPGTQPRLTGLTSALDDVQLAAEVRRTVPLSLRLMRLGGEPIVPALVRALQKAAA